MAVQTQIQTRRGSAATWTSTNPTLAAGEIGFESDTNKFKIGTGSTAWASLPYAASLSPLTTKGDLYTYSTADARLAVGANGETLVADSSTATGLRYQGNFAAGKNRIINGDFNINQRAFTSSTSVGYGFDRWLGNFSDGTVTYSAQTFTPGAAPVAGYEATNYARLVTSGQTLTTALAFLSQKIEDVRIFANQTVTVSFYAQADSGTPKIAIELDQQFGSGGSTRVTTAVAQPTISTSWVRYSASILVPSISGKTIGTSSSLNLNLFVSAGSDFNSRTNSLGIQSNTFNIWGVQVEPGSVATAFQTATGTIQGELAACQRYYYLHASGTALSIGNAGYYSATQVNGMVQFPVSMRTAPSLVATSGTNYYVADRNGADDAFNSFTIYRATLTTAMIYNNSEATGTAGHAALLYTNNASSSVAFSAEL
jgi:hypothetical protein